MLVVIEMAKWVIKARAKRGPSLFEVSDHRGIGASPVVPQKVVFVFGVLS